MGFVIIDKSKIAVRVHQQFYEEYPRDKYIVQVDNDFIRIREANSSHIALSASRINFVYINKENE